MRCLTSQRPLGTGVDYLLIAEPDDARDGNLKVVLFFVGYPDCDRGSYDTLTFARRAVHYGRHHH